jgi:hypothetical protein
MPSSSLAFFLGVASTSGQIVSDTIPVWYLYLGIGFATIALGFLFWSLYNAGSISMLHRPFWPRFRRRR